MRWHVGINAHACNTREMRTKLLKKSATYKIGEAITPQANINDLVAIAGNYHYRNASVPATSRDRCIMHNYSVGPPRKNITSMLGLPSSSVINPDR